jgi:catechol 2,3-dioxygenase-like lactoylglutathione lyase family enzyme
VRRLSPSLLVVAVATAVAVAPVLLATPRTADPVAIPAREVAAVGMTVSDMDRALTFYSTVLSFERVSDVEVSGREQELLTGVFGARMRVVRMRLGSETIELTEFLTPKGRPVPADARGNDRFFQHLAIVVRDIDEAYAWLTAHRVEHASTGPQRLPDWNPNAGGISAFYFRDPDGHFLEIIQFPAGKGDPRWQRTTDGPRFLGIDHTAITIGDTDESLRFYRDLLGLRVAGESENYDVEQEHLNNVFGARLRITGLRAPRGPGIELLEYLAPRDGRPSPPDLHANDLSHWQTTLVTDGLAGVLPAARAHRMLLVSPGPISIAGAALGFANAALVRDPDGHGVRLVDAW